MPTRPRPGTVVAHEVNHFAGAAFFTPTVISVQSKPKLCCSRGG